MLIRTRTGVSVDGFIAAPDEVPVFVVMPGFVPHESYGWPEFDEQIDAVVLGRVALDTGLAAKTWPMAGQADLRPEQQARANGNARLGRSPTCLSFAVPSARAR